MKPELQRDSRLVGVDGDDAVCVEHPFKRGADEIGPPQDKYKEMDEKK